MDYKTKLVIAMPALLLLAALAASCGHLDPPPIDDAADRAIVTTDIDDEVEAAQEPEPSTELVESEDGPLTPASSAISREQTLMASLTIFVLAVFLGFELITKVPPTLHTPLMSGSNAISGITLVGAALMAGNGLNRWSMFFGFLAVILATINVVGGFLVTDRMLAMFKRK